MMKKIIGVIFAAGLFYAMAERQALTQGATTLVQIITAGSAVSGSNPLPVSGSLSASFASQYPTGAVPLTASATGTTGATTATLTASALIKTYICGFTITSDATAAIAGTATVSGTVTGTLSYIQNVGSATAAGILTQTFNPCIPSSAVNTAIAVNSVAAGVGGNTAVVAWGFQL